MAARIRAYDWATTPLGSAENWSERLKVMVEQVLASPLVSSLVCGSERVLIYNDPAAALYGDRHPAALGRPLAEAFPEGWTTVAPFYERAFAGEIVPLGGQSLDTRGEGQATDVFDALLLPVHEADGQVAYVHMTGSEVGKRASVEVALRDSEERQAFLLKVSDALRPVRDTVEIQRTATRMLGEWLGASRVFYVVIDNDGDTAAILDDYTDGVPSRVGRYSLSAFSVHGLGEWRAGRIASTSDVDTDPRYSEAAREAYASVSTRAGFGVPLIKDGRLVAILGVNQSSPRHWAEQDLNLASEIAERTWAAVERALAEATLRESEARFRQFAASSSDALWIRDAATLAMEYVSPAIRTIYGVPPETILADPKHWAAVIVPEDRAAALAQLERARAGEAVTHAFRILRVSDGAFRWIRNTDFPLLDERGRVQRIGGIAEDVTEAKQGAEHQSVLLHELQHRVRNILAMIRSIADQTGDTARDVADYRDMLAGRLRALARVQVLLTQAANAGVDLATLIRAEVAAQAAHARQYSLSGSELLLPPKAAEVLTLAIHELATNALKYGAFSHAAGRLAVTWRIVYPDEEARPGEAQPGEAWLRLDWVETGATAPLPPPQREGFGTLLIRGRIPYELRGHGRIAYAPEGARCRLAFPLRRGDSILETDAVILSTTIPGGSLDMTGEADLSGCRVLVVEDDFFLARDTARGLRKAGGTVLGPFGQAEDALALIAREAPSCAVVDINLGQGAEFRVAEALQAAGVPFVFVTGYDDVMIPDRFDGVERLRKPVEFRQVVRAAALLCAT